VSERQSGMFGLLYALESVATLLLMCDRRDLGTAVGEKPPAPGAESDQPVSVQLRDAVAATAREFFEPNLYLYDAYPGGTASSHPSSLVPELLVQKTRELINACACEAGSPSCAGPAGDLVPRAKEAALAILDRLCA